MHAHWTTSHTRTDCTRDNRRVILPNASRIGFAKRYAKRGFWIYAESGFGAAHGRVLGRVQCEGKVYVEALMLIGASLTPCVRWIEPCEIREALAHPPRAILQFIAGDWSDPAALVEKAYSGALAYELNEGKES